MVRRRKRKGRGLSLMSLLMLGVTLVVLVTGVSVVGRLRNSKAALSIPRLTKELTDDWSLSLNELPTPGVTRTPPPLSAMLEPAATSAPRPTAIPEAARTVSLTLGGSFAVQSNVRQSCYYAATRSYDFG